LAFCHHAISSKIADRHCTGGTRFFHAFPAVTMVTRQSSVRERFMRPNELKSLLETAFPGARIEVASPDDVHFQAVVVAETFAGQATLARHRMVYAALGKRMGGEVHALSLRTLTPAEAEGG